jgi:hypothetical protein
MGHTEIYGRDEMHHPDTVQERLDKRAKAWMEKREKSPERRLDAWIKRYREFHAAVSSACA